MVAATGSPKEQGYEGIWDRLLPDLETRALERPCPCKLTAALGWTMSGESHLPGRAVCLWAVVAMDQQTSLEVQEWSDILRPNE